MKINIGSKNAAKIQALKETISDYEFLKEAEVLALEALSQVGNQPKSLEETVQGAMNRAKNAFLNCDLSVGLESGLMEVPHSKSNTMDVCVCAFYDGEEFHLGLSSAFELPSKVHELMIKGNLEMSQAINKVGLTDDPEIGSKQGAVGILTRGRITRSGQAKQAIITALIHLENAHLFKKS